MKKEEFERELSKHLEHLIPEERQKTLDYYDELFCDRAEHGEGEEEIIASFGSPEDIATQISGETVFIKTTRKVKDKLAKTTHGIKSTIAKIFTNKSFLIFYFSAFIITFPLTIVAFSLAFALTVAAFSLALGLGIAVFAIVLSVFIITVVFLVMGPVYIIFGPISAGGFNPAGFSIMAGGVVLIGLGIAFLMLIRLLDYLRILVFVKRENKAKAYSRINRGNFFIKLTIIACVTVIAGGAIFTAALASADFNVRNLDTATYTPINFTIDDPSSLNTVRIRTTTRNITLVAATENFRVTGYSNNESRIAVEIENNALVIRETYRFEFMQLFNIFQGVNWRRNNIRVYLPAEINQIDSIQRSGNLTVEGITTQSATITTTSGNVTVRESVVVNIFQINTGSGNIDVRTSSVGTLVAHATSGNINTRSLTATSIDLRTTSGNIDARLIGSRQDYDVRSSVRSGRNRVGTNYNAAAIANGNTINIRAGSGNINLSFSA